MDIIIIHILGIPTLDTQWILSMFCVLSLPWIEQWISRNFCASSVDAIEFFVVSVLGYKMDIIQFLGLISAWIQSGYHPNSVLGYKVDIIQFLCLDTKYRFFNLCA